ncbi:MAG: hypothetical protein E8D45_06580 [Nitrospira sp.]|nr:MAG: hypothetical protein E8D45_06580 [Nitrospira sp.]
MNPSLLTAGSAGDTEGRLARTYAHLLTLWTSGVRDYHSLLSAYLLAHSIFVAVIGLFVSQHPMARVLSIVIALLSVFGILLCLQMAIVLGRFSAQNSLWEWHLRGLEGLPAWPDRKLLSGLRWLRERHEPWSEPGNEPPVFRPAWAFRTHRQWWAHRAVSFPLFFGSVYGLFLVWSLAQAVGPGLP